jgi:hypothetical protein
VGLSKNLPYFSQTSKQKRIARSTSQQERKVEEIRAWKLHEASFLNKIISILYEFSNTPATHFGVHPQG